MGVFLLSTVMLSCKNSPTSKLKDVLSAAGANDVELLNVIQHFKNDKDTLKRKAAFFLIENLKGHTAAPIDYNFDKCFTEIEKIPLGTTGRREKFDSILSEFKKNYIPNPLFERWEICETIKAEFIIKNIELAFKAWYSHPENIRANFEDFCSYILPFTSTNEPLETDSRLLLFNKYSWVIKALNSGVAFKSIVDSILRQVNFINMTQIRKYYPYPLSISQMEKSHHGLCDDGVNYFVNLFRSIGIICSKDQIIQWGNHQSNGHSWIYLKYGNFEYATDIGGDGIDLRTKYKGESIPKVYRSVYRPVEKQNRSYEGNMFLLDTTPFYVPTTSLAFPVDSKDNRESFCLNVFNGSQLWRNICNGTQDKNSVQFKDIGVNCIYILGYWKNGVFTPKSLPFFINLDKSLQYFTPSNSNYDSIKLIRKIGLATARNLRKLEWIEQLAGCYIEGANNRNFKNADLLHTITPLLSTNKQVIELSSKKRYRFVRFNSNNKESYLAHLRFLNNKHQLVKGIPFYKSLNKVFPVENLDDDKAGSFSGGTEYYIGFDFGMPVEIKQIEFQPRNDDNAISPKDSYTLYCWLDNQWRSMDTKTATDTLIYFKNIPKNSLMFLKNNTRGVEHYVFSMDKTGLNQVWYGFVL